MPRRRLGSAFALLLVVAAPAAARQSPEPAPDLHRIAAMAAELEPKVVAWRRDIHEHPELSNREFRTGELVADHLESLGIEVTRNVAHTGVVGVLRGGRPGPVVALRADMDALPVPERNDLPFRSRATGEYNGETVPVMHACGHDTHVAILMGVAEALAGMQDELAGTVKFLFQPAEEGAPAGEDGGAELMVAEGALGDPAVDVVFGLHISAQLDVGKVSTRPGPLMASAQDYRIVIRGTQAHGANPWLGVDPIVTASQVVTGLQTIVARNLNITEIPAIVTVGKFSGGVRSNIIPEEVEMVGTIRTFGEEQKETVHRRIREIAEHVAASAGASAEVTIPLTTDYPVTVNDDDLTERGVEVLKQVAGDDGVVESDLVTGAEDFSYFAREVPGFFFFLGGKPLDVPVAESAAHHTPDFFVHEDALELGVRSMLALTLDALGG